MDYSKLHLDVAFGRSRGKIIWQPRLICWYQDRMFANGKLEEPYTGMSYPDLYKHLNCSARVYEYNGSIQKVNDPRVKSYSKKIDALTTEYILECPAGKVNAIMKSNTSNYGVMPKKWWVTTEDDLKVFIWLEENCSWSWNQKAFDDAYNEWGNLGAPTIFMERINIQRLYIDLMGVEGAIYALYDYPDTVEAYFKALDASHESCIREVINPSPIQLINFGDNIHAGTLPPNLFEKYVLPAYQKRNEILHQADKFTYAHWDGDTKPLLPYAKDTCLSGIEAITPKPQGDVTLQEVKAALGDDMFLIDGIAAILFEESYPIETLEKQTREVIELFGPKLILGISDEISSNGNLDRVKFVGEIVDEYNNKL